MPVPLSVDDDQNSASGGATVTIFPYTRLRMLRPKIAIAVVEAGMVVVYHCMDNARYE